MKRFEPYDLALELIRTLPAVLTAIERKDRDLGRQMRRAAASVPLNIAEAAERAGKDRPHLLRVAAGSAREVLACIDVALAWGYVSEDAEGTDVRQRIETLLAALDKLTAPNKPFRNGRADRTVERTE